MAAVVKQWFWSHTKYRIHESTLMFSYLPYMYIIACHTKSSEVDVPLIVFNLILYIVFKLGYAQSTGHIVRECRMCYNFSLYCKNQDNMLLQIKTTSTVRSLFVDLV